MQFASAGEVAERIDVRAKMSAQSEAFRSGAAAVGHDVVTMHLGQAEEKWRMHGMMGHANEVRLGEIVDAGGTERVEEWLGDCHNRTFKRLKTVVKKFIAAII